MEKKFSSARLRNETNLSVRVRASPLIPREVYDNGQFRVEKTGANAGKTVVPRHYLTTVFGQTPTEGDNVMCLKIRENRVFFSTVGSEG